MTVFDMSQASPTILEVPGEDHPPCLDLWGFKIEVNPNLEDGEIRIVYGRSWLLLSQCGKKGAIVHNG